MALDWASDSLTPVESWRIQMAILTYLVDLFDVYDKVHAGLVDQSHLDTRINTLKLGVMKTTNAKLVWSYWKNNRSPDFVRWFEKEIYGADSNMGDVDGDFSEQERAAHSQLNTRR
jgi:hypothetical protein